MQKLKTLFIDDCHADNVLCKILIELDNLPLVPTFCINAIKALAYLRSLNFEDFPEIIITDVNMPLIDGFEFVKRYEQEFYQQHPTTKLFITTSSIRVTDKTRAKESLIVSDFLLKPFSKEKYEQVIAKHLNIRIRTTA